MSDIKNGPRPTADPSTTDNSVERLLRSAGPRPPVPEDAAAMVKAAAHHEWQNMVQAEKQRSRFIKFGGFLAAAALLALMLNTAIPSRQQQPTKVVASLEATLGMVRLESLEGTQSILNSEEQLSAGSLLTTTSESRAVLRLASGPSIRLDVDTRLRFVSSTVLELEHGAVYADSDSAANVPLEIQTPLGTARDIGTRFEVRLMGSATTLRVRVRDGTVLLQEEGGSHVAEAGTEFTMDNKGAVTENTILDHGELWDWTLALLPHYDAQDKSLDEFLLWAAQEGGWQLTYSDNAIAQQATQVYLSGSVTGLSLADATEVALLGSGLQLHYRIEENRLVVFPADG